MPEGVNMECIGRYLQSLRFYVENNKFDADFSEYRNKIEKLRLEERSTTWDNLWSPIQVVIPTSRAYLQLEAQAHG